MYFRKKWRLLLKRVLKVQPGCQMRSETEKHDCGIRTARRDIAANKRHTSVSRRKNIEFLKASPLVPWFVAVQFLGALGPTLLVLMLPGRTKGSVLARDLDYS
jgi:hypothetical protein